MLQRLRDMPSASTRLIDPEFRGSIADLQIANHSEMILTGPTRTGKTLGVLWKVWKQIEKYDGARALLLRKRRTDLSETALVTLERDVIGQSNALVVDGPSRDYRKNYQLENNSILVVGGMDKPGKILSSEFDIIVVPQAEELAPADWETLITRLSGTAVPPQLQQIIGDCNPASPYHWIMQRSLEGNLKLWETYHKDNPLLHDGKAWTEFGQAYLDRLSASLTGNERQRLLEGKWVQAEGVVYKEFGSDNIVDTEPNFAAGSFEIAMDDGFVDPRVFLLILRTGKEVFVFDEIYHSQHIEEECVKELLEKIIKWNGKELPANMEKESLENISKWCKSNEIDLPQIAVGSPEAKTLHAYMRKANISVRNKAIPTVVEALKPVRKLIKDGRGIRSLKVHGRCKNFIGELTDGYKYPAEGARRDDEKPIDENNHACDAFRDWAWTRARRL